VFLSAPTALRSSSGNGCATNLSHPHQPLPLDGCPMFAEFRVHGLKKMGEAPSFSFLGLDRR
jgi:hypothetical protein